MSNHLGISKIYPAFTPQMRANIKNLHDLMLGATHVPKSLLATSTFFPLALSIIRREPASGVTPETLWLSPDAGNPDLEPILILSKNRLVGDCVIGDKRYMYSMTDLFVMKIEVVLVE